jgi:phosphoribosylamine---glycine ligase
VRWRGPERPGADRVLVIDGTGRGHAICDLFVRTDSDVTVYYGPGCDVIEHDRIIVVPSISLADPATALAFLASQPVELVFVASIDALSNGYADVLRAHGHRTIGPSQAAAELASSKQRGKRFCRDHGLATAAYRWFTEVEPAKAYVRSLPYACVVKADGPCRSGDGSVVCDTAADAERAVDGFARRFGGALRLVIEERLRGPEISISALLDGESYLLFPTAMAWKRALDGDRGPGCDGMAAVAPHPMIGPGLEAQIRTRLLDPLVRGLRRDGLDFTGFISLGAMITEAGLSLIEIDAQFADAAAHVVLPSVHSDFTSLCRSSLDRTLRDHRLITDRFVRCAVALTQGAAEPGDLEASPGPPFGAVAAGQPVSGLDAVDRGEATLFFADLRRDRAGRAVTSGGRVLHAVGKGRSVDEARGRAYRQISRLTFPGMRYRSDIAGKLPGAEPSRGSPPAASLRGRSHVAT